MLSKATQSISRNHVKGKERSSRFLEPREEHAQAAMINVKSPVLHDEETRVIQMLARRCVMRYNK